MSDEKKTVTVYLYSIKDPDRWQEAAEELGLSRATRKRYFEFGEYANLELVIDSDLNIVGGRIVPQ